MTRVVVVALVLLGTSHVLAQGETQTLPNGWSVTGRLRRLTDVNGLACADDRAYARGWGGGVVAWSGSAWSELPEIDGYMQGRTYGTEIAASSSGVLVEASGRVAQWDGSAWTLLTRPGAGPYEAIGGIAAIGDEVLVVGRGRIERREGTELRPYDAATWRDLSGVAGASSSDVWTAGQGGTLLHWDGHGWSRAVTRTEVWLGGLLVVGRGDVWAWSDRSAAATLLHWDGRSWLLIPPPEGGDVLGVASRAGRVWVATSAGVFEHVGSAWTSVLAPSDFGDDRHAILGICATRTHLIVGAGLASLATRPI
jgi:hypothetical protein